jgi:EmrB/QacA subfamily drug resistance transporter
VIRQRGTLAVVCLATAMLMLDIAVVNTAMSQIAKDLDAGLPGLQWVVDAYTLALASVVLNAGSLADRFGRRRLFSGGMALFGISSAACALAGNIAVLDASRAVQGIAGAALFATSLAILADAFRAPAERMGALAAYGATIGASFAVGPVVGGALTSAFGWRSVFLINIPLAVAGLVATAAWVRESRDPHFRPVDWAGQITLTGGLFLLVLALLRGNDDGWGSRAIVMELAGAAVLLAAFAVAELRGRAPMLPPQLFRRPDFTTAQLSAAAISASFFAVFLYLTLYLQQVLHLSPIEAGAVYLPGSAIIFVVSGASAQLAGRVQPATMIVTGLVLVAAGMALMTIAGEGSSWTAILPGEILAAIGTGLFNPAVSGLALGAAPAHQSGLAAGVNDTFRQAGIALAVAFFGTLVPSEAVIGNASAAAYVDGLHHALYAGAGIALAGAVVSAVLMSPRRAAAAPAGAPALDRA